MSGAAAAEAPAPRPQRQRDAWIYRRSMVFGNNVAGWGLLAGLAAWGNDGALHAGLADAVWWGLVFLNVTYLVGPIAEDTARAFIDRRAGRGP
jgi:hypothetical protein